LKVFIYLCDKKFHIDPLKEQLVQEDSYGFLVIDGNETLIATVQGNQQQVLFRYRVDLPKKHTKGGQSAGRFFRLRLEARHHYLTKMSEFATKYFIDPLTTRPNVKALIIAGSADFKDQLSSNKFLDQRLVPIVASTLDIAFGGVQGLAQAVEMSGEILKSVKLVQQSKMLARFFEEISKDSGLSSFGVKETMQNIESGAVKTLLIWENLELVRHILASKSSDDHSKLKNEESEEEEDQDDFLENTNDFVKQIVYLQPNVDPNKKGWQVISSEPLIDYLTTNASKLGGGITIELISDSTSQGSQFCKGFGGIGALLRFPVKSSKFEGEEEERQVKGEDHQVPNPNKLEQLDEEDDDDELAEYFSDPKDKHKPFELGW